MDIAGLARRVHAPSRAADWWSVDATSSAFEQVLDAKLAAQLGEAPRAAWTVDARPDPGLRVAMAGGATWFGPGLAGAGASYGPRGVHVAAGTTAAPAPRPAGAAAREPAQRACAHRQLAPVEREALSRLRQWGAPLPDDFTHDELKRAYRHLAQQFHPDHHATASPATRAALGGVFHQIHVAYRLLAR
jgi:hypothetical protein